MPPARQPRAILRMPVIARPLPVIAASYLALAMVLGGGGSTAPISELLLQLVAALTAAAWLIAAYRAGEPSLPADRLVWTIAGLVLVLPVVQLLPLPAAIWQSLPGRAQELAALRVVGEETRWMPWSMTPARTLASLLAILPALLAMAMVARLDLAGRRLVIMAIAGVALASLVLGALQLSGGNSGAWRPYGPENGGYLHGFQANRNAEADVLLIGIVALAAVLASFKRAIGGNVALAGLAGGTALLAMGCLTAGSRTGLAMLPLSLLAAGFIWFGRRPGLRALMIGGGGAAIVALGTFLLVQWNARAAHVFARFTFDRDPRADIWADTMFAISRYWPFGSGLGSFKPIYFAAERLEFVDPFYTGRAHNDYLELALEGGIFGLALLVAIAVLAGWMFVRRFGNGAGENRSQPIAGMTMLIIVASHSAVDYPLRSMAIACIAGAAVGLLSALPANRNQGELPAR
ncbi:MAG: O-antigen ligase family protein [Novosphingobium sp.]